VPAFMRIFGRRILVNLVNLPLDESFEVCYSNIHV
jgi:hypothetical protein